MFQLSINSPGTTVRPTRVESVYLDLSSIPPEYHKFAEVFSKQHSKQLLEHCPYNLII